MVAARGDVEAPGGKFQLELSDPLEDASSNRLGIQRLMIECPLKIARPSEPSPQAIELPLDQILKRRSNRNRRASASV